MQISNVMQTDSPSRQRLPSIKRCVFNILVEIGTELLILC